MLLTTVTLDAPVTMEMGKAYGLLVAKSSEITHVHPLVSIEGTSATVTLQTPIDDADPVAPGAGDHIVFGELGLESVSCIVRDIEPTGDLEARITLVPEAPAIHDAGAELPEFDPGTTPVRTLPTPEIQTVISDITTMIITPTGTLEPRVIFTLAPIAVDGADLIVLYRISDTDAPFAEATVQYRIPREAAIVGVEAGEVYDFRLFYSHPDYFVSAAGQLNNHQVTGSALGPPPLTGLTIVSIGGLALVRWNEITDVDVRFGGTIVPRWSPQTVAASASWGASVSIGDRTVAASATFVYLPLKPGTYLFQVVDGSGLGSAVAKISTKQATAIVYSPVSAIQEHPAFSGVLSGVVKDGAAIKLAAGSIDSEPDWDAIPDFDAAGVDGAIASGTYEFAGGLDLGSVQSTRLTGHIVATTVNDTDLIDSRTEAIDDWPDIDGVIDAAGDVVDAVLFARETDDDPAGSPNWGEWQRLDSAEFNARAFEFYAELSSRDPVYNVLVTELAVAADQVA